MLVGLDLLRGSLFDSIELIACVFYVFTIVVGIIRGVYGSSGIRLGIKDICIFCEE